MTIISDRMNGPYRVQLYSDGTKIRTSNTETVVRPPFPETIDVKITNYCNGGCRFCFESSTIAGQHGNAQNIVQTLSELPPGTEIALGGGNPLSHPDLEQILVELKKKGLVCNITVMQNHFFKSINQIKKLQQEGLLYGVGVSGMCFFGNEFSGIGNIVSHLVLGVNHVTNVDAESKILLLGYKQHGFGKTYHSELVDRNIREWKFWIRRLLSRGNISFDNLALEQLRIRECVLQQDWDRLYMGDDGAFSMYLDLTTMRFGKTSTETRKPIENRSIREIFASL